MTSVFVGEKTTTMSADRTSPQPRSSDGQAHGDEKTTLSRTSNVSVPSTVHQFNPFDTDVEAMVSSGELSKSTQRIRGGQESQVWPGQAQWKRRAKDAKRNHRACNCLSHLKRRDRIVVKVLIVLLIVGIAVGIGVGVSKPLGAGIWHNT